jgi:hypothetical protein
MFYSDIKDLMIGGRNLNFNFIKNNHLVKNTEKKRKMSKKLTIRIIFQ